MSNRFLAQLTNVSDADKKVGFKNGRILPLLVREDGSAYLSDGISHKWPFDKNSFRIIMSVEKYTSLKNKE